MCYLFVIYFSFVRHCYIGKKFVISVNKNYIIPEYQKQGIGKSLINEGLSLLKELHGQGCALVGDPNYYKRFGFQNYPKLVHEGVPQEVFLALPFNEKVPQGTVIFHEGFLANGYRDRDAHH